MPDQVLSKGAVIDQSMIDSIIGQAALRPATVARLNSIAATPDILTQRDEDFPLEEVKDYLYCEGLRPILKLRFPNAGPGELTDMFKLLTTPETTRSLFVASNINHPLEVWYKMIDIVQQSPDESITSLAEDIYGPFLMGAWKVVSPFYPETGNKRKRADSFTITKPVQKDRPSTKAKKTKHDKFPAPSELGIEAVRPSKKQRRKRPRRHQTMAHQENTATIIPAMHTPLSIPSPSYSSPVAGPSSRPNTTYELNSRQHFSIPSPFEFYMKPPSPTSALRPHSSGDVTQLPTDEDVVDTRQGWQRLHWNELGKSNYPFDFRFPSRG